MSVRRRLASTAIASWCVCSSAVPGTAQQAIETKLDPKIYDPFLGSYRTGSGELVSIGRTERRLYYFEPRSGIIRGLERDSETTWSAGPSLLVYSPVELQLTFVRNGKGEVTGLVLKRRGRPDQTAKKAAGYREERVTFRNGDVTLAGTLLVPSSGGPHPAVVFLHGSGPQDRNGYMSLIRLTADHFARNGIATLIYDKRGVGASSGNWADASFDDMAGDAVAGLRFLQSRGDIRPRQIGLWGSSQAGWVMAKATSLSKHIAFIISVSAAGSGYTVAQQELYNVETEMRAGGFSQGEIDEVLATRRLLFEFVRTGKAEGYGAAIQKARQNSRIKDWLTPRPEEIDRTKRDQWFLALDIDFDPVPLWGRYEGPVLQIFGELDASTPVRQVVPIVAKALASRKNTDFAIKVFPKAHHLILEAKTGSDSELEQLKRYAPGYFDLMTAWLLARINVEGSTQPGLPE
jgi:pimeloyl-ACP methyl ester carboxylesterase